MTLIGGYWFFFLLRVNVVHDGHSLWRLERADLFIVTLLASVTFALLLEFAEMSQDVAATKACASIYIFFTTLLFVSVPWSKFAHMFYKPDLATVIPAKAGIQLIQQAPHCGTKPNCILNNSAGFRPSPE